MYETITLGVTIAAIAFAQNTSFTMVSRSRNRDNKTYHAICSVFSNGLWLLTFGLLGAELLLKDNYIMAVPYIIGTVSGSLFGASASIRIEKLIGAKT